MKDNLIWNVKIYNCNSRVIEDYNVLKYEEEFLQGLKKKAKGSKEYFSEKLKSHLMYHYWSRSEWEVIVVKGQDRVLLRPWCGCLYPEEISLDVTNDDTFDWRNFADRHIKQQIFNNEAKIDVWDQIDFCWDKFVDYCWNIK